MKIETAPEAPAYVEPKFEQVTDGRGRPISGLYIRNEKYYIQVHVAGKGSRRFMLRDELGGPVQTITAATEAAALFKKAQRDGLQPEITRTPLFRDYFRVYIQYLRDTKAKDPKTIMKEEGHLNTWAGSIGHIRVKDITLSDVRAHVQKRSKAGLNPRTCNLDVLILGNMLRHAREDNLVLRVVTEQFTSLKHTSPKSELFTFESLDKMVAEALRTKVNEEGDTVQVYPFGRMLADWLKLMAYSGARRTAALQAKWSMVDMGNRQITFLTKFSKRVTVEFNAKLEAHLQDMLSRREEKGGDWLLPSPYGLDGMAPLTNMHKTLTAVRNATGFPHFHPHLLRHAFISYAVMQGIPYMTIASWVGHSDGGVLIGKVYGHLNPAHKREQANKLSLTDAAPQAPGLPTIDLTRMNPQELLALLTKALATQQAAPQAAASTPAAVEPAPENK